MKSIQTLGAALTLVFFIAGCGDKTAAEGSASAAAKTSAAPSGTASAAPAGGGEEPFANKFCKGPDGTVQDCAIACDTSKRDDVCKLYETKTKELCNEIGKAKCQEICDGDKNKHACEHAKSMK